MVARRFLVPLDLNKLELQNAVIQNLGTAPSSPVEGQIYYDTGSNSIFMWDGADWVDLATAALTYDTPGNSAVGDSANEGVATEVSRADHRHGREAFGAVTGQTSYGASSGNGSASTVSHSDHTHGTPSLSSNAATNQAIGDSATNGTGTAPAKDDHKHGMPAFAAPTAQTSFGASSSTGSASTLPHSDHAHGTPTHDATAHSAIKISDLAAPSTDVSFNSHKITNLTDGSSAQDAATYGQLQAVVQGLDWKQAVRVIATSNGTLATAFENGDTVDGVTLATGDRILLAGQSTAAERGIYTVNASGAPTRATDADASGEIKVGTVVPVQAGTANANTVYYCTATGATPWVPGSSSSTWSFFFQVTSTQAGAGLTASSNVLAVGAGTGISVNADDVAINTSVVARKATGSLTGGATSETITHNLGTRDVVFSLKNGSTPWDEVEVEVEATTTNTLTIRSVANLPASYTWVVVG